MDIYQRLKVKTYINAWDAVSAYGSSRMEPETLAAMRDAASKYVPIRDLQQAVGRKIAQMTGNEAAYVVSGTAAGMLLASAVCMVRHPEPELFAMLPNAQELRNEFILLRGAQDQRRLRHQGRRRQGHRRGLWQARDHRRTSSGPSPRAPAPSSTATRRCCP